MKKINFLLAGLMALAMTTLTSCLNGDDNDEGITYYIDDFLNLTENGKILTTDDNYTFLMENFEEFKKQFPNPPARMFFSLGMYVPADESFDKVYTTPLTPVTVRGACAAGVYEVVREKPEGNSAYQLTQMLPSASKLFLNCLVYTTGAKTPKHEDFKAYVSGVATDGTIYVKVVNCTPTASDNVTGTYGLSFPLSDLLYGINPILDDNGCIVFDVEGTLIKLKR